MSAAIGQGSLLRGAPQPATGRPMDRERAWWPALANAVHKFWAQAWGQAKLVAPLAAKDERPQPNLAAVAHDALVSRPPQALAVVDQPTPAAKRNLAAAAATLGVATVGTLVYPPLHVACLPGFLYLGANSSQTAYQTWRQERRLSLAATETAAVALCVWQGYFLAGAFGFSLYYLGQVVAEERRKPAQPVVGWQSPAWAWRQSPAGEVVTPVSALQAGDCVVVHASEMAPCTGVVASGMAWVRTPHTVAQLGAGTALGERVSAGQRVEAATIVLAGSICVLVTAA